MFCKYCGKELSEQAIVCPGCGCLASASRPAETEAPMQVEQAPFIEQESAEGKLVKNEKKAKIFSVLGFIFLCVEAFFLCAHIADALYCLLGRIAYHDEGGAVMAFLISWAALAMGITAFVFGIKIKKRNVALSTITIFVFVASIVGFIIPMVCM